MVSAIGPKFSATLGCVRNSERMIKVGGLALIKRFNILSIIELENGGKNDSALLATMSHFPS